MSTDTDPIVAAFRGSDGTVFHAHHWKPLGKPRCYLVALHGIQSHAGWYRDSSRQLCSAGIDVRYLDRRGSGVNARSQHRPVHHERLINDVVQFLCEVRHERNQAAPAAPIVLSGVSWGGKLAVAVTAKRPELVDGLALLAPGIKPRIKANWLQSLQLKTARAVGIREKQVPIPLDDVALFTSEPEKQDFIQNDELALHQVSVAFLLASEDLDRIVQVSAERIRCPCLLMLAGKDRIIDNLATRKSFEHFASVHQTIHEYSDAAHTLEFEPNREAVFEDFLEWLKVIRELC